MLNPDFSDMLSAFTGESVEYLVVGAYALAAHGVPRATGDLDFWIRPTPENASRVLRALAAFGAPTADLALDDLTTPDLVFQIGVEPNRIDILTSIDGVTFDEAGPRGRRAAGERRTRVPLIPPGPCGTRGGCQHAGSRERRTDRGCRGTRRPGGCT
jgi:hypothetical protein